MKAGIGLILVGDRLFLRGRRWALDDGAERSTEKARHDEDQSLRCSCYSLRSHKVRVCRSCHVVLKFLLKLQVSRFLMGNVEESRSDQKLVGLAGLVTWRKPSGKVVLIRDEVPKEFQVECRSTVPINCGQRRLLSSKPTRVQVYSCDRPVLWMSKCLIPGFVRLLLAAPTYVDDTSSDPQIGCHPGQIYPSKNLPACCHQSFPLVVTPAKPDDVPETT